MNFGATFWPTYFCSASADDDEVGIWWQCYKWHCWLCGHFVYWHLMKCVRWYLTKWFGLYVHYCCEDDPRR